MQALNDLEQRAAELQRKAELFRQGRSIAASASQAAPFDTPITHAAVNAFGHGSVTHPSQLGGGQFNFNTNVGGGSRASSLSPSIAAARAGGAPANVAAANAAAGIAYLRQQLENDRMEQEHQQHQRRQQQEAASRGRDGGGGVTVNSAAAADEALRLADFIAARQPSMVGSQYNDQPQGSGLKSAELSAFLGLPPYNNRALSRGRPSSPTRLQNLLNESDNAVHHHPPYPSFFPSSSPTMSAVIGPTEAHDLREAVGAVLHLMFEEERQRAALATTQRHMHVYREYLKEASERSLGHWYAVMEAVEQVQRLEQQRGPQQGYPCAQPQQNNPLPQMDQPTAQAMAAGADSYEKHRAQFLANQQRLVGDGGLSFGPSSSRAGTPSRFTPAGSQQNIMNAFGSPFPTPTSHQKTNQHQHLVTTTMMMMGSPSQSPPRDVRFTASANGFPSVSVPLGGGSAPFQPNNALSEAYRTFNPYTNSTPYSSSAASASPAPMPSTGGGGPSAASVATGLVGGHTNYASSTFPTATASASAAFSPSSASSTRNGVNTRNGINSNNNGVPFSANDIIEEVQAIAKAREARDALRRQQNAYHGNNSDNANINGGGPLMY